MPKIMIDMNKNNVNAVEEKVGVISGIALLSRILLGTAFVLGCTASVMAFMYWAKISPPTRPIAGAVPLKLATVTKAIAVVDQSGTFVPLDYYSGATKIYTQNRVVGDDNNGYDYPNTNLPLSITLSSTGSINSNINANVNTNTPTTNTNVNAPVNANANSNSNTNKVKQFLNFLLLKPVHAQTSFSIEPPPVTTYSIEPPPVTTYSIEPVVPTGFPVQMLIIKYRQAEDINATSDRTMTICVGAAAGPSIWVGADGSTYLNKDLTTRTTPETCAAIKNRVMKITYATDGNIVSQPNFAPGSYVFFRSLMIIGRFDGSIFTPGINMPITIPNDTPLIGGFNFSEIQPTKQSPPAYVTLTQAYAGASVSYSMCFPPSTFNSTTGGQLYYYGQDGTPYADVLLQHRVMKETCTNWLTRAYSPLGISNGTMSKTISPDHGIWVVSGSYLYGVIGPNGWNPNGTQGVYQKLPLALALSGANTAVNVPTMTVSLTDQGGTVQKLCWGGWNNVKPSDYTAATFYDSQGQGYSDLFLTQKVNCTTSSGSSLPTKVQE